MPKTPLRRLTYKERTQPRIARELGIPRETVGYCIQSGQLTPHKGQGRKPILNTPLRRLLVQHATQNALGISAFEREMYYRRVAIEKPFLTKAHKSARLTWAGGQVFVTRHPEEKYLPECCVAKFKNYSISQLYGILGIY
ncbi:hypothetical protein V2W45_1469433 [Cenococcum geophilum]